MLLKFFKKNRREELYIPQYLHDALGPGIVTTPLKAFNLDYDYLKSLSKKYHPDTGEPVVNEATLEIANQLTINPTMVKVERPGLDHPMTLSLQHNLRTTAGANWQQNAMAGFVATGYTGTTAASSGGAAQSLTDAATSTYAANYWADHIIVADTGTAHVMGECTGHAATASAALQLFVDAWHNPASGSLAAGSIPGNGAHFSILPATAPAFYVALTTTNITPVVGDTALTGEYNSNGVSRVFVGAVNGNGATNPGFTSVSSTQYTFAYKWTFTGAVSTTFYAGGLFTGSVAAGTATPSTTAAGGGRLFLETVLSSSATVSASGDTVQITWTVNI